MPVLVDLINQVQKILPAIHGGTGNDFGGANERLIAHYMNDTGGTLALGTLVKLQAAYDDTRVVPTTAVGDIPVGVVVGRYSSVVGTLDQFEAVAPAHQDTVAVCVAGRCAVLVAGAVTVGGYGQASATSGKATTAGTTPGARSIGQFESSTTGVGQAMILLTGAAGSAPTQFYTINFVISGGVGPPELGVQGETSVDAAGTIVSARMLATTSGSAVVDIKKSTYAGFPGSLASITSGAKPTLSAAQKSEDTTLSGWTTSIAAGDVLQFQLDSASGITCVTCALKVRRTA